MCVIKKVCGWHKSFKISLEMRVVKNLQKCFIFSWLKARRMVLWKQMREKMIPLSMLILTSLPCQVFLLQIFLQRSPNGNIFTLTFNPIFSPPLLHSILINPILSSTIKHFCFSDTLQSCCGKWKDSLCWNQARNQREVRRDTPSSEPPSCQPQLKFCFL